VDGIAENESLGSLRPWFVGRQDKDRSRDHQHLRVPDLEACTVGHTQPKREKRAVVELFFDL